MSGMDETNLRQRIVGDRNDSDNVNNGESQSASAEATATTSTTSSEPVANAQTEYDAYFESLRVWLQQVQLQQTAMAMFPYYLANCQQLNAGFINNGLGASQSNLPQYQTNPMYFSQYATANRQQQATGNANPFAAFAQQQQQQQQPNAPNPNIVNNNNNPFARNQFADNFRRNEESKHRKYY